MNVEVTGLLTQIELAKRLKTTTKTIRMWERVGVNGRTLKRRPVGRKPYYDPDDVLLFLGWTEFPAAESARQPQRVAGAVAG